MIKKRLKIRKKHHQFFINYNFSYKIFIKNYKKVQRKNISVLFLMPNLLLCKKYYPFYKEIKKTLF